MAAVGTQRFFVGGRGEELVVIVPDGLFLVYADGLLTAIERISQAYPEAKSPKVSKDIHEVLRKQLHKRQGTLVHYVHRIYDLWIEMIDSEKLIMIG